MESSELTHIHSRTPKKLVVAEKYAFNEFKQVVLVVEINHIRATDYRKSVALKFFTVTLSEVHAQFEFFSSS